MTLPSLTSLELHLRFAAGSIQETRLLQDSACGIYPSYYRVLPDRLKVSTSAAALIREAGGLDPNPAFRPREYLQGDGLRQCLVHGTAALPGKLKEAAKRRLPAALLRGLSRDRFWYESWETLDTRVRKLRPFERLTPAGGTDTFQPDYTLRDPEELVERVAAHLVRFVRDIESHYPRHHHVMLIGGKDSLILALIPKRRPELWHVFSADPNRPLVERWLETNGVAVASLHVHDNGNEETPGETERKIICSDLYSDPRHLRWLPTLSRLAASFEPGCLFWSGSAADALHVGRAHHRRYLRGDPRGFFDIHLTRVPCLVGNYHQVVKNFTGCPLLCPYQSPGIWRDVYTHLGPATLAPGVDIRPRLGERLAGRPIRWPDRNPGPDPYRYAARFDARSLYLRHLGEGRDGGRP